MSGKQHAVMWLGIILIIVRLFTTNQWSILWSTISTNPTPGGPNNAPAPSSPAGLLNTMQNIAHLSITTGPLGFVDRGAQAVASQITKHL